MRRLSWLFLILAGAYLVPAIVLDFFIVRDMGTSYEFFDTIAMAIVSAPVGLVTVGLLENTIPLDRKTVWFAVLVASQCGNVLIAWGLIRGLRLAVRSARRLVRGGNPPVTEIERMRPAPGTGRLPRRSSGPVIDASDQDEQR